MRQRVKQHRPQELAETPQTGPAKGPAARATLGPLEPSPDSVQPAQALALQPLLGNAAVAQLVTPASSPPVIQRLTTTSDSLGETGTVGKGKALVGESNYVKIKKELSKYYKASKPPERTKHLNKIVGLIAAWMKQNESGKSKGNSMRKTKLEVLRSEIQQELAVLAKPPPRPSTPAHVAAGIAGPPPTAGATPAPAKPARPKAPAPVPDRFLVDRPKPQKPARPAAPAPAVAGKQPARPKSGAPAKPSAAGKKPARPKTGAPAKLGAGGAAKAAAWGGLGGVYGRVDLGPPPNVGLNAAVDKIIATTDEGTLDPAFVERFSDSDVAGLPFVERFSDIDVAGPAFVERFSDSDVIDDGAAAAPVPAAAVAPAVAAAPTPDDALAVALGAVVAPAPAVAAAPDLTSAGMDFLRLADAAVFTIKVAEKVALLQHLEGPLLELETLLSDPVMVQSADPDAVQVFGQYAGVGATGSRQSSAPAGGSRVLAGHHGRQVQLPHQGERRKGPRPDGDAGRAVRAAARAPTGAQG